MSIKGNKHLPVPVDRLEDKPLIGYKEISNFLRVSVSTVKRHIDELPVKRFGKRVMVLEGDLRKWLKQQPKIPFYHQTEFSLPSSKSPRKSK